MKENKKIREFSEVTYNTIPQALEFMICKLIIIEKDISNIKKDLMEIKEYKMREIKDEFMTFAEALDFLKIKANTLHRWKRDGNVPYSKVGTKVYFKRGDLENYNKVEIKRPRV